MGMYDYVRCDYMLTPEFSGECQTKDINGDIGGTMSTYYIDPAGRLWYIDYYGTTEYVLDNTKPKPWPYVRLQTGKRGKVKFMSNFTNYLTIYPSSPKGSWKLWTEARLHIVQGKIQTFKIIKRENYVKGYDRFQSYIGGY